jgi:DNA-directed RNA polymerase II subunit RPB2
MACSHPNKRLTYQLDVATDYGYSYASANGGAAVDYDMETKPKLDDDYDYDAGAGILSSEDLWTVISSFFSDQGLVNQQLSSYNQFMETTMQAIMMEHGDMTLDQISQHSGGGLDQTVCRSWR